MSKFILLLLVATPLMARGMDDCAVMKGREVPSSAIGLPTHGAVVRSARATILGGQKFCKILGAIRSVDPAANPIRFEVNLPETWNGKAVQFGGGAFNGALGPSNGLGETVVADRRRPTPLQRGYATWGSDSGHHHHYLLLPDILNLVRANFGLNDEERKNFASESLKKTHDVALVLIKYRYGAPPKRVYFIGGSTGGREAMMVVDRWPQDYDGVLAAYAAWNQIESDLQFIRISQAMYAEGKKGREGWLPASKAKLLRDAVLRACDAQDGLKDGIVSDPADCHFDPATLRCPDGNIHRGCLSDGQERTIAAFATPQISDFFVEHGINSEPGFNALRGTSLVGAMGLLSHPFHPPLPLLNSFYYRVGDGVLRFFLTKDPHFDALTFDTKTGGQWVPRILEQSKEDDASLADLTPFQEHGGKLILVHGTADPTIPTDASVFLYQRIVSAMGQPRVNDFVRLYLIPGYGHGRGVFDAGFDTVGILDAWAEKSIPPAELTVSDQNKRAKRTRPLCQWPGWPKFQGGDANQASNFACQ